MQWKKRGRIRRRLKFQLLAVAALAVTGPLAANAPAAAEDYRLLSLQGLKVKWGETRLGTPAQVRYAFLDADVARPEGINCRAMRPFPAALGQKQVTSDAAKGAFRAAFRLWASVAAVSFREVADEAEADVVIGVQADPTGIAFADVQPDAVGGAPLAAIRRAAICLNPEKAWKSGFDGNLRSYDLNYVALHEIGHVLGLDHVWSKPGQVMSVAYTERHLALRPGDIAGARILYGVPISGEIAHAPEGGGEAGAAATPTGVVLSHGIR